MISMNDPDALAGARALRRRDVGRRAVVRRTAPGPVGSDLAGALTKMDRAAPREPRLPRRARSIGVAASGPRAGRYGGRRARPEEPRAGSLPRPAVARGGTAGRARPRSRASCDAAAHVADGPVRAGPAGTGAYNRRRAQSPRRSQGSQARARALPGTRGGARPADPLSRDALQALDDGIAKSDRCDAGAARSISISPRAGNRALRRLDRIAAQSERPEPWGRACAEIWSGGAMTKPPRAAGRMFPERRALLILWPCAVFGRRSDGSLPSAGTPVGRRAMAHGRRDSQPRALWGRAGRPHVRRRDPRDHGARRVPSVSPPARGTTTRSAPRPRSSGQRSPGLRHVPRRALPADSHLGRRRLLARPTRTQRRRAAYETSPERGTPPLLMLATTRTPTEPTPSEPGAVSTCIQRCCGSRFSGPRSQSRRTYRGFQRTDRPLLRHLHASGDVRIGGLASGRRPTTPSTSVTSTSSVSSPTRRPARPPRHDDLARQRLARPPAIGCRLWHTLLHERVARFRQETELPRFVKTLFRSEAAGVDLVLTGTATPTNVLSPRRPLRTSAICCLR